MPTVTIDLPEDAFAALQRSPREFAQEMRLAAAMFWYSRARVSQGVAAEIAGMSRPEFLETLWREKVDAFPVDFDELKEEIERGRKTDRERLAAHLPVEGGPP